MKRNTLQHQWKDEFRMSKKTFESIIEIVRPSLQKQNTQLRNAIPMEKRVAVAIWRLATGDSYTATGKTFEIGKSTAVSVTHDFYKNFLEFLEDLLVFRSQEVKLAVQSGTLEKRPIVKFCKPLELSTVLI